MATTSHNTIAQPAVKNRVAFHIYVQSTLTTLLACCELFERDQVIDVQQFRLKDLKGNLFEKSPLLEVSSFFEDHTTIDFSTLVAQHLIALTALTTPAINKSTIDRFLIQCPVSDRFISIESPQEDTQSDDFTFSYPIPLSPIVKSQNQLVTYTLALFHILLDLVDLYGENRIVTPTKIGIGGKKFNLPKSPPHHYEPVGQRANGKYGSGLYQPLHTVLATEPTIVILAKHWGLICSMVRLVDLSHTVIHFDGFCLKRTTDWVVPSTCRPSQVYEYLARVCNVTCKFCYLYGNPDSIAVGRGKKVISHSEIETRLKYYRPDKGQSLFHAQWEINEFLIDPKLPHVLKSLRAKTQEPFFFITNGNPLTPKVIELLSSVRPVSLIVSTNVLDAPQRAELMGESPRNTRTALNCLEELKAQQIPFGISLVAFPEITYQELERTLAQLETLEPSFVRINLPGFTKDHPYKVNFDTEQIWADSVLWIKEIRSKYSFPIICIPSAYEENYFSDQPNGARIIGRLKNSPAYFSAIKSGDIIRAVNGLPITSRSELIALLMFMKNKFNLTIEREGHVFTVDVNAQLEGTFPYAGHFFGKYVFPHGLVIAPSLGEIAAPEILSHIQALKARKVWFFTSKVMLPAAELFKIHFLKDIPVDLTFKIAENHFLGGNIRIADMCTVGDFALTIEKELSSGTEAPDLILLSATGFNSFGRDLSGKHWSELERFYNIPVRLITKTLQFAF